MSYYETELGKLYKGDCLEIMDKLIADGVVVDAIITDPPYQTTACVWDTLIPFNKHIMTTKGRSKKLIPMYEDEWIMRECRTTYKSIHQCTEEFEENCKEGMWDKLNKLIKPNGAMVLFSSEPFSSTLKMSNIKNYKYDIIWDKVSTSSGVLAKKRPLNAHELISIFYTKQPTYNPQMQKGTKWSRGGKMKKSAEIYGDVKEIGKPENDTTDMKYPKQISTFSNANRNNRTHPAQKPVALMEYLIKTYTNEGELVLDFTSGSGSTAIACENTNRKWICIEKEEKYCEIHKNRINLTIK